jgi:phosphoketolase
LICKKCGSKWLTAELPEKFLDELVELRDALKEIKQNAESYMKESKKAATSLEKLSASLSVLRALKAYREQ